MIQNDISIIVVDDKKSSSAMISTTLGKAAYEDIRICLNAAQALAEIRQRPADVLLADWEMPEMTGLQLTDKVRELDEDLNHYTAVILLTGNEESDAVLKAFELGVDDYVVKKEDKRELLGRVHAACRIATMQNTLLDTTHELTRTARLLMDKSTTHPLTGMPNRNAFELQLDSAIRQVATRNGTVACAIIHLLDFEKTEANLDRESADGVLVGAAKRIVRAIRPMDFIGHIGREQFAISKFHSFQTRCFRTHHQLRQSTPYQRCAIALRSQG